LIHGVTAKNDPRPPVSTHIAGIPELVKPDLTGWLVPAGDDKTLATP
jgi:hypothetical protein